MSFWDFMLECGRAKPIHHERFLSHFYDKNMDGQENLAEKLLEFYPNWEEVARNMEPMVIKSNATSDQTNCDECRFCLNSAHTETCGHNFDTLW